MQSGSEFTSNRASNRAGASTFEERGGQPKRTFLAGVACAGLAGAVLRLGGLSRQVLGGDELHAVRTALGMPLAEILTHYAEQDHCLPLAAFYRLCVLAGIPLSETLVRAPVVICGLALPFVVAWAAQRWLDRPAALAAAWLTAVSPLLVIYGRIARPYAPAALLFVLAFAAFWRWRRERGLRWSLTYAVCGAGAIYFHLVTAPAVVAPVVLAAVRELAARRWRRFGAVSSVGLGLAVATAALILPAASSLRLLLAAKTDSAEIDAGTLSGLLQMFAGGRAEVGVLLFWGLALYGLVRLARSRGELAVETAFPVALQILALLALAPTKSDAPLIFSRYAQHVLPLVLFWVGVAVTEPIRRGAMRHGRLGGTWAVRTAGMVALFTLVAAFLATGPLGDPRWWKSSFAHHREVVGFEPPWPAPTSVPAAYRFLVEDGEPGEVVEAPWRTAWRYSRLPGHYQRFHGREVVVASDQEALADPRLALRWLVPANPDALLASGARYLVLHHDWGREEDALPADPTVSPQAMSGRSRVWRQQRRVTRRLGDELERLWGLPLIEDGTAALWDLEAIRSGRRTANATTVREEKPISNGEEGQ